MRLVLAHGVAGTAASMLPHVTGLRERGIEAAAIDIPKRKAEQAVAAYLEASGSGSDVFIGGQSYGGRVATLLAAEPGHEFAGLVLLSYPLHRPGAPEWEPRTLHWTSIAYPVLMLSGEADPLARIDLLRTAVARRLPNAELVTYPGLGHTLKPVLGDVLDRIADFIRRVGSQRSS